MRRRVWIVSFAVLVALVAALAFFARWLLYTPAGLQFALRQLDRIPTMRIEVTGASGTLVGPLSFDRIVVDHEAAHIDARGVRVVSRPRALLAGRVTLDDLVIERVAVQLKERPEPPPREPHFLPAGLSVRAEGFRIGGIDLTLQGGQRVAAREARGTLALTRWRLEVDPLTVRADAGGIAGSLALRATEPLGLRTDLRGDWRLPGDEFEYRFRLETRGRLDRLGTELYLDAPAKLSFSGTLLDLTENPRARGTFRFTDFDGSPWMPAGRIPRLSGTIALGAGKRGLGFDGTFTSPALSGQPLRLQGSGRYESRRIDVTSLRVWLPRIASSVSASGVVELPAPDAPEGTLPRLELTGDWSGLRWPVEPDAEPVVTSAQGAYTLEGALPYVFNARASVAGVAIPSIDFEAGGALDRERLTLDRFDGYVARGRVQGRGSLQWSGEQRWKFEVDARALALAELRKGLDGRLDARGTIEGAGFSADAPWTARLASMSGRMFGRPLTGRGEIAHRDGQFDLRRVRIENGNSFADVNGRVGPQALDLDWNLDLRTLAIVAEGMSGQLVSRGRASGSPSRPQVRATGTLRNFQHGDIVVDQANVDADIDTSDRRPSRATIEAGPAIVGGIVFDTVRAGLSGTMREHELTFAFSSPGDAKRRVAEFRGGLRAQGGLDFEPLAWAGDLEQADVVFPDGEARLIQPASLVLGPELQRASPVCLRTAEDARVCVEGEHRPNPQSWRVIYSAQDWPLQRLLRTMFGWKEFDGRLQASGWAEQAPGRPWVGGSTMLIHEPALQVPRNKFRTERIQLGSSRLDLFAEPDTMRASLAVQVDESTDISGEAQADRRADLLASPLQGRISGRSEAIKLLPLLIPEVDRAVGRLDAEIRLGGTLGEPQFNGSFQLRDGRLDLYRTNLALADLRADGQFTGDELKFTASGQTPKGRLDIDGEFGWPQGVMTGAMRVRGDQLLVADTPDFRVIASPDVTVYAGRGGFDVQGVVTIPTARISPREITTTVTTSPDERIVGVAEIEEEEQEPSTADRITSTVRVVLGDAVRVDAYGLRARLQGELTVRTVPEDVARADGAINVVDGEYRAFGQAVKITKGVLRYVNAPLDEPLLEIVAERAIKDTDITVTVNVRGTLANPFVTITSTPAMPSNEALSYLLTGRSLDTLQSGEAANVNQAAESLALSGGGLLLGGIGKRVGLDEISVERSGEDDTAVVLGKALSPKLYVSYGIAIAEAINTIKLRYTLNERWSVKAEAGLEQSVDVEFRIER